jgi:hypothetical protein
MFWVVAPITLTLTPAAGSNDAHQHECTHPANAVPGRSPTHTIRSRFVNGGDAYVDVRGRVVFRVPDECKM